MKIYPTDLTDSQWSKIEKFFTIRKRKHSLRKIVNALLYITKSEIQLGHKTYKVFISNEHAGKKS